MPDPETADSMWMFLRQLFWKTDQLAETFGFRHSSGC
jgi:hypothetical protein